MGSVGNKTNSALDKAKNKVLSKFKVGSRGRKGTVISEPVFNTVYSQDAKKIMFSFNEEQYYTGSKSAVIGIGDIPGAYRTYKTSGIILTNAEGTEYKITNLNSAKTSERPLTREEKKRFKK